MLEFIVTLAATFVGFSVAIALALAAFAIAWKVSDIVDKKFGTKAGAVVFALCILFAISLASTVLFMLGGDPQ